MHISITTFPPNILYIKPIKSFNMNTFRESNKTKQRQKSKTLTVHPSSHLAASTCGLPRGSHKFRGSEHQGMESCLE